MDSLSWKIFFDGLAPVFRTLILGTLSYIGLVILLRSSGKRTLSKMNAFDFVVTVALGSTLASILTSRTVSLLQGLLALALLILLQLINAFLSVRWRWYQSLLKAQPTLLFFQGRFLRDAMRKQRVSEEEILAAMRTHGVAEPSAVDAVILETEGTLSVLKQHAATRSALSALGVDTERPATEIKSEQ